MSPPGRPRPGARRRAGPQRAPTAPRASRRRGRRESAPPGDPHAGACPQGELARHSPRLRRDRTVRASPRRRSVSRRRTPPRAGRPPGAADGRRRR